MLHTARHPDGTLHLHIAGPFDGEAAADVISACAAARLGERILLDLHDVTLFRDTALSAAAPLLARRSVHIQGAGARHAAVLRYFGCDAEEPGPGARDAPDVAPDLMR